MQTIESLLQEIFAKQSLLHAVLSSPLETMQGIRKLTIRPVQIKQNLHYQLTRYEGEKTFHSNLSPTECLAFLLDHLNHFKQTLLCTSDADYQILVSKKQQMTILKKPPTQSQQALEHNRKKQYLLEEGVPVPFLVELGIMSANGQVIAKKSDKFRQLNRFLELIDDVLPHLKPEGPIRIVDFGCGKAYLTFALYHYLHGLRGYEVEVSGLDLKKDVITTCQALAKKLGYKGLHFSVGNIVDYIPEHQVDMVITLHACDTATDAALAKAVHWQAGVILCVPCCQKELFRQVRSEVLAPILRHGILKERFAALATDAARAQLLDIAGYQTQVLEFIDLEHTPKNLLIRAIKRPKKEASAKIVEEYQRFKDALGITCSLESLL